MPARSLALTAAFLLLALVGLKPACAEHECVVYDGFDGPGNGRHIVLVSGDDEYRSEEALPQLGKILAVRHGFKCTVLFAIDPATGEVKPDHQTNIPGLAALESADLMVLFTRFRNLPDEQMKYIDEYVSAGKPIIAMRTSTHAFNMPDDATYAKYSWRSKEWPGGFGRQILGETWVSHHGHHGRQSTRGIIADGMQSHPILTGVESGSIWGPTDVYGVRLPLPEGSKPLVFGQVLEGMNADDEPVEGEKNDPMMPIAWIKPYTTASGKVGTTFTTTMGASQDLENESLRRMLVNACYWSLGMTEQIPEEANVDIVGKYEPTRFGFGTYQKGMRPKDHLLERDASN